MEVLMNGLASFIQWLAIVICSAYIWHNMDDAYRGEKWVKWFGLALFLLTLFSPIYFEYADWGSSVPVTFDGDKVIRHDLGLFTVPFSSDYQNMVTGDEYARLMVDAKIVGSRREMRILKYNASARIVSPERYFAKPERKKLSTAEARSELRHVADSLLLGFVETHPGSVNEWIEISGAASGRRDGKRWDGKTDSLKNVFSEWLATQRGEDSGIKVTFGGVDLYRYNQ
jgi:hypothetical protein